MQCNWFIFLLLSFMVFVSCKEEVLPKPRAQLRLEYPQGNSDIVETPDYSFQYNTLAQIKNRKGSSFTLEYPGLKGAVFITYKPVENN